MRRLTIEVIKYRRVCFSGECTSDQVADPLAHSVLEDLPKDSEPLDSLAPAVVRSQALLLMPGRKKFGARLIDRVFRPIATLRNRSTNR